MALSLRLVRRGREAEADGGGGNGGERTLFLGQLGLLIGGVNFLLIALEGLYAVLLEARRCG
jgi:hypothetical protein